MSHHDLLPASAARRPRRLAVALAVGALTLAVTQVASAYPDYPGYMQNILDMPCAPTCLLCHTDPAGGAENVKGAFGDPELPPPQGAGIFVQNLIRVGPGIKPLEKKVPPESAMATALEALRTVPCGRDAMGAPTGGICNTDADMTIDYDELKAGGDPEDGAVGATLCNGPRYGCGAHVAPAPAPASPWPQTGALLAALGVVVALVRRFRA